MVIARFRGGVSVAAAMAQRSAGAAMAKYSANAEQTAVCLVFAPSRRPCMLGIEVLEVKFMGQERFYGASTGYPSVKDIVAGARAGHRRGGRQSAGWQRYLL